MVLDFSTYLNGISGIAVAIVAGFVGVRFILNYRREHKKLMPYVSIVGFSFVGLYLGPIVTFWSLVFTGVNIDPVLYGQLSYMVAPVAIINAMWLGFSIFNPEKRKLAVEVFLIAGVIFYIAILGFPADMIQPDAAISVLNAEGRMLDISLKSVVFAILAFDILAVIFILAGGFYYLRPKISGIDRQRATYLCWGFLCFGIAGLLETAIATDYVVIARIIMITFLVLIYLGFSAKSTAEPEAAAPAKA